jgi:hypothetical protein
LKIKLPLTQKEFEELEMIRKRKAKEILKKKGMKEFTFDGITVLSLNEKNAIRKIGNIKKLLNI